ncbi:hypothetical protein GW17_00016645 [Ensete ventricosum]|nr:hypothetical protein GW17_00016645 [Ensete ventricosum]
MRPKIARGGESTVSGVSYPPALRSDRECCRLRKGASKQDGPCWAPTSAAGSLSGVITRVVRPRLPPLAPGRHSVPFEARRHWHRPTRCRLAGELGPLPPHGVRTHPSSFPIKQDLLPLFLPRHCPIHRSLILQLRFRWKMYRATALVVLFVAAAGFAAAADAPAPGPNAKTEQPAPTHSPAKSPTTAPTPANSPVAGPANAPATLAPAVSGPANAAPANAPGPATAQGPAAPAPTTTTSPSSSPAAAPGPNTYDDEDDIPTDGPIPGSPPALSPELSAAASPEDDLSPTATTSGAGVSLAAGTAFGALSAVLVAVFAF